MHPAPLSEWIMGVSRGRFCATSSIERFTSAQSASPSARPRATASFSTSRISGGSTMIPSCAMVMCSGKYQARAWPAEASIAAPAHRPMRRLGQTLIVEREKLLRGDSVRSMNQRASFEQRTVDELTIGDERSFRHVALYADLKEILRRSKY